MSQSEEIKEIAKALCLAQKEMRFAVKDSENPHFKSKYADLAAVWDAIREPLTNYGLSVSQTMEMVEGKIFLVSTLMHISGQWIRSMIPIKTDKDTAQGWGSGITYFRRYSLAALVGCVQDDDDGNAAEPSNKPKPKTEKKEDGPITDKQRELLEQLAPLCDKEYLEKILDWLSKKGIDGINGIKTSALCETIISGMKKNAEMNKGN